MRGLGAWKPNPWSSHSQSENMMTKNAYLGIGHWTKMEMSQETCHWRKGVRMANHRAQGDVFLIRKSWHLSWQILCAAPCSGR